MGGLMSKKDMLEVGVVPTPEFLEKHSVEHIETRVAGKKRMRVTDQLWIDYYLKHKHIDNAQYLTATRLLALYRAAGRAQKVTGSLDGMPKGGNGDMSDRNANSLADFNRIARRMGANSFSCVESVVLHDISAAEWARINGRNPKAAPEIFRMALDDLEDAFKRLRDR
jgi:hypothetical protein